MPTSYSRPPTLEKKKRSHPTICHPHSGESRFPSPWSQFYSFPLWILRLSALLTKLLALGSLGGGGLKLATFGSRGGPWRLGRSPEGSLAHLARGSHWLLSPLPMSLCAPPTTHPSCDCCPPTPLSLTPCLPLLVSASPSVCLYLRKMSRRAACWRRWAWHSPPRPAAWRCGELMERRASVALFLVGPAASPSWALSCGLRTLKHSLPPIFPFPTEGFRS